jgi:hypothetical protein
LLEGGAGVKSIFGICAATLLLSTASVLAQANKSEPHTANEVMDFWVSKTEQLLVPAADAMPQSKYSFAPSTGEFSGVRTFAEQVKHLAAANYQLAAAALGENPPAGTQHETAPDSVRTKAQIMTYLRGSFAALHRAAAGVNEQTMNEPMPSAGNRTRLFMLVDALLHASDHYGQMVEYLRMNHVVPPASRGKAAKTIPKGRSKCETRVHTRREDAEPSRKKLEAREQSRRSAPHRVGDSLRLDPLCSWLTAQDSC